MWQYPTTDDNGVPSNYKGFLWKLEPVDDMRLNWMALLRHTAANRALIHCTTSVDTDW